MTARVLEMFGCSTSAGDRRAWQQRVRQQGCPFLSRKCLKVRKSKPDIAIGTCTVAHGSDRIPVMICPHRLLQERRIFVDCLHLLTLHEPGNELHIVSEISVPGGSVDYFLASARNSKVKDFVGIELQTLDSTGTVWPERQRFLQSQGLATDSNDVESDKPFGMNWKMTAKTILMQLHHKIVTFEHLNKHLALVIQDCLLDYMQREFAFGHFSNPAQIGEFLHVHGYHLEQRSKSSGFHLQLVNRLSTDSDGVAKALGLQSDARVELKSIIAALEAKISPATRFVPV